MNNFFYVQDINGKWAKIQGLRPSLQGTAELNPVAMMFASRVVDQKFSIIKDRYGVFFKIPTDIPEAKSIKADGVVVAYEADNGFYVGPNPLNNLGMP